MLNSQEAKSSLKAFPENFSMQDGKYKKAFVGFLEDQRSDKISLFILIRL